MHKCYTVATGNCSKVYCYNTDFISVTCSWSTMLYNKYLIYVIGWIARALQTQGMINIYIYMIFGTCPVIVIHVASLKLALTSK